MGWARAWACGMAAVGRAEISPLGATGDSIEASVVTASTGPAGKIRPTPTASRAAAERERAHDEWMRAEEALQAVDAAREELEAKAESLRQQLGEADASSILATQLQQQLELAEKQAAQQGERLAKSEKKRAALKKRLEKQSRHAEEVERRAATA